ncbi:MAG: metallophosphoesterase family protein [Planctomycetes bacterium]|nr:metallophosphoesterase family protein [Planctomycetota bacterium]
MLAIISDLHGNIEALENVMNDIRSKGIKDIICLGDVVGYGPNPAECIDIAMNLKLTLRGNHEEAVIHEGVYGFNPLAQGAINWTRKELKPGTFSNKTRKARWDFISNLPLTYNEGELLFVHGSPRDPVWEYILRYDTEVFFEEIPAKIKEIFSMISWLCFVGHSHDPGIITQESDFFTPKDVDYEFEVRPGRKYIINVGSVGQPRDGDNRACYVTFDNTKLRYHRIAYDIKKIQEKVYAIPELDKRIGERLEYGR